FFSLEHLCCSEVSISPLFRWPNSVCHFILTMSPVIADGVDCVLFTKLFIGSWKLAILLVAPLNQSAIELLA
ncbi:hypothetical protein EY040_21845, partial [Shigella flexneri]|nr:hypothetical protein [Shigella flexneri]